MQWILQEFEDTQKLADALDRLGLHYSWHKVVPFVGELIPEPVVHDPDRVVFFGSYTLWRFAAARGYKPGVFKLAPFVSQKAWHPHLVNGPEALFLKVQDIPSGLKDDGKSWFLRPVDDSKEEPGRVRSAKEILELAGKVLAMDADEVPSGSLRHDTEIMLTEPARIHSEWRIRVVREVVVTYSLYKDGSRVVYRPEIDDDALAFAQQMVAANPGYADAYVMDICRTPGGLRLLDTNCLNAAGFYAADLQRLAVAIEELG